MVKEHFFYDNHGQRLKLSVYRPIGHLAGRLNLNPNLIKIISISIESHSLETGQIIYKKPNGEEHEIKDLHGPIDKYASGFARYLEKATEKEIKTEIDVLNDKKTRIKKWLEQTQYKSTNLLDKFVLSDEKHS